MGARLDMRDAKHWLMRASLAAALALAASAATTAGAEDVVPTGFLHDAAGRPVAMTTNEADLYFVLPSRWAVARAAGAESAAVQLLHAADAPADYDLRLVLAPDYGSAAPVIAKLRDAAPRALFFPVPMTVDAATLFLPEALGSVEAELTPDDDQLSTPMALYYRIRLNEAQLASLRMLARGGLTLQGALTHRYAAPDGAGETTAPLTIVLSQADLTVGDEAAPAPGAWLASLLETAKLSVARVIDGKFALGGGVQVSLADTRLEASFLRGTWSLRATEGGFAVRPTEDANLGGRLRMRAPALGLDVIFDVKLALEARLDLTTMRLTVDRCSLREARLNGASNPFYTTLLRKLVARPELQARVGEALSDALQRRILEQTLFGLEESW